MIDTHRSVKTLEKNGFDEAQAEAIVAVVSDKGEDLAT